MVQRKQVFTGSRNSISFILQILDEISTRNVSNLLIKRDVLHFAGLIFSFQSFNSPGCSKIPRQLLYAIGRQSFF